MPTATKTLTKVRVQVTLYTGDDILTGKPKYRSHSLSSVRKDVTARETYDVVDAIYELQEHMIYNIEQVDVSEITGS